jgi:hypothetical protein
MDAQTRDGWLNEYLLTLLALLQYTVDVVTWPLIFN